MNKEYKDMKQEKLIEIIEDLNKDNENLNNTISDLEDDITELKFENEELEDEIETLKENEDKDINSNNLIWQLKINNMYNDDMKKFIEDFINYYN